MLLEVCCRHGRGRYILFCCGFIRAIFKPPRTYFELKHVVVAWTVSSVLLPDPLRPMLQIPEILGAVCRISVGASVPLAVRRTGAARTLMMSAYGVGC